MAAVVRVKRRCDEEPLDALVFACKRKKTDDRDSPVEPDNPFTVVKFAATVKSQSDDFSVLLPVSDQEDIWHNKLRHKVDVLKKIRQRRKEQSENSRYKVVNCFRHSETEKDETVKEAEKNMIVFEVESSIENSAETETNVEDDSQYVYDIYYGYANGDCDFVEMDHLYDIMPYSENMDFDSSKVIGDEESLHESDDSNDENNWRNDYPDSDNSINEDDMRLAMQMGDMNLGQDNELSSSDDELIYGVDADPEDVEYHGEVYAKYKARIKRELNDCEESSDDSSIEERSGSDEDEDPILRFM